MSDVARILAEIDENRRPNTLYRIYAPDGVLLYIGITKDLGTRLKSHNRKKDWFTEAGSIRLEHFLSRDAVEAAERAAIANEHPLWNITHKRAKGTALDEIARAYDAIELAIDNYRRTLREALASGVVRQVEVAKALGRTRESIRLDAMTPVERERLVARSTERKRDLRSVA